MDRQAIELGKHAVVERYGPWTGSNVALGEGLFTMEHTQAGAHARLVRFGQLISDLAGPDFKSLRILDLGCHEGEYAIEFARLGAEVVGIEGREANVRKAMFARDALGLGNLQFFQDDVMNLSAAKYGRFDAVLCSGLLYHLDKPDVAAFLERVAEVCRRCVIVDTHVSPLPRASFDYKGRGYSGGLFTEHHRTASTEERVLSGWASLENRTSFWFTRASLSNALTAAGFTSVAECRTPAMVGLAPDRVTVTAIKGVAYVPATGVAPTFERYLPESEGRRFRYYAHWIGREIAMRLPRPLMRLVKRIFSR